MDERGLIEAAQGGSEAAFAKLVEKHQDRLYRFLVRYVGEDGEAEDIAQEVFLKAFVKIRSFQGGSGFYTWLYRIGINTATDWMKRRRRHAALSLDRESIAPGLSGDPAVAPGRRVRRKEQAAVVQAVLAALPDRYRVILALREFEGMSYQDMARTLRCSIGTVESRLFRARERFRKEIEARFPEYGTAGEA